ncbi:MAG: hypothetical protein Alpg2KO_27600 [Alphaproteobacteria bacterium]
MNPLIKRQQERKRSARHDVHGKLPKRRKARPILPKDSHWFFHWIAAEASSGRAKIQPVETKNGVPAMEIEMSLMLARRFAIGAIKGVPFIGVQMGMFPAIRDVPWTLAEAYKGNEKGRVTLHGKGSGNVPLRLVLPSNPKGLAFFMRGKVQRLDLRRVAVSPMGKVSRIATRPFRSVRLVRRTTLKGANLSVNRTRFRFQNARQSRLR